MRLNESQDKASGRRARKVETNPNMRTRIAFKVMAWWVDGKWGKWYKSKVGTRWIAGKWEKCKQKQGQSSWKKSKIRGDEWKARTRWASEVMWVMTRWVTRKVRKPKKRRKDFCEENENVLRKKLIRARRTVGKSRARRRQHLDRKRWA